MLGTAFKEALGDKAGVRRFASRGRARSTKRSCRSRSTCPGRPFLVYEVDPVASGSARSTRSSTEEFWRAFAFAAGITLHMRSLAGKNGHHVIEASFKGVARSAPRRGEDRRHRSAVDERRPVGGCPSTCTPRSTCAAGRCVRLHQGDFEAETVYDDDPVRVAHAFAAAGARWIHVVDLDAARTGERVNLAVDRGDLCRRPVPRSRPAEASGASKPAASLLAAGAARVVVGTAAIERPELVEELCDAASRARSPSGSTPAAARSPSAAGSRRPASDLVERRRAASRPSGRRRARRHRDRPRRHHGRPRCRAARCRARGDHRSR